jgi:hypothetical protein
MLQEIVRDELLDRDSFREIEMVKNCLKNIMPEGYVQYYKKKHLNYIW